MILEKFLNSSHTLEDQKQLRWSVWISFISEQSVHLDPDIFGSRCQQWTLLWCTEQIAFCYFPQRYESINKKEWSKVSKKSIKQLLNQSQSWTLGTQLKDKQYLVLMFHTESAEILVWVDIINKQHPKVTTTLIDTKGHTDADGDKVYKNRTIEEQLEKLKEDLNWWSRKLSIRIIKKFFQKDKLTETFYHVYKNELFDEIKKDLKNRYTNVNEDQINNFILINLNRLLFIHFLDKKWDIFQNYDAKRGSYISYLFHHVYRESKSEKSFYKTILQPLFFEVFAKPQWERQIAHIPYLFQEFYNLPYLNGGLFKASEEEKEYAMIIDNYFIKLFITKIIDQFNFTITEDTPLDVSVAVDPELLWYIFENLIQEYDNEQLSKEKDKKTVKKTKDNQRSSGGIFYTPKIEVDFMCRQSLIEWLAKDDELKNNKKDLYELFYPEAGDTQQQKHGSFNLSQITKIFSLLENIRVVDPACWSWAFLVGMMQVILDIENTLLDNNISWISLSNNKSLKEYVQNRNNIFERKKQLIRQSLHGVDIKSWAVEIAKLRLWLSMIVDAAPESFLWSRAKTEPLLPSFAFKIVQGDSLINRIGHGLIPLDLRRTGEISAAARLKIKEVADLKQKFYENSIKDEYLVRHEEFKIFHEIILNKIRYIKGERTKIIDQLNESDRDDLFWQKKAKLNEAARRKLEKAKLELSNEIESLESQLNQLAIHKKSPFARGIAFSDVLIERWWFDILVGNPPYVRQEEIADPTGQIKDKKVYKDLCQHDLIRQDRNEHIEKTARIKWGIAVWWRSDLYLYFYFRGLALINDLGMFSFITSNSFLDVDFGASLQEFLIRFCPRIKVIDNAVQRSFASASINTVMVFLDKPVISTAMFTWSAQFINFSKEYDQALWSETLAELDPDVYIKPSMTEKTITTGDISFRKRSNELLRVIDISAIDLWNDGSEEDQYTGNKWWGKYLRAPNFFFELIDNQSILPFYMIKDLKVRRWYIPSPYESYRVKSSEVSDLNWDFKYVFCDTKEFSNVIIWKWYKSNYKLILSDNEFDKLNIETQNFLTQKKNIKYKLWIREPADLICLRTPYSKHLCYINDANIQVIDHVEIFTWKYSRHLIAFLFNFSLFNFVKELYWRTNLGLWVLKLEVIDWNKILGSRVVE